jgi:hypothetical protein
VTQIEAARMLGGCCRHQRPLLYVPMLRHGLVAWQGSEQLLVLHLPLPAAAAAADVFACGCCRRCCSCSAASQCQHRLLLLLLLHGRSLLHQGLGPALAAAAAAGVLAPSRSAPQHMQRQHHRAVMSPHLSSSYSNKGQHPATANSS